MHRRLEPPALPRLLPWLPVPVLLLLLTHTADAVGLHVPVALHLLMPAGTAGPKKVIFEYVILAGSSFLPHFRLLCVTLGRGPWHVIFVDFWAF